MKFPDGAVRWLLGNALPQREADGSTLWHGYISDVTERKQVGERQRENEMFLRETQRIARLAGWKANPYTDFLEWTDQVFEIVEAPKGSSQPGLTEGLKFYLPEYRPLLRDAMIRCLATGERFALECQGTTGTGRTIWTEVRGLSAVSSGHDAYVIGTFQDITERRQAELSLRQSEARFRTLVENIPQKIFIKDRELRWVAVNASFARDFGLAPADMVGKSDWDFFPKAVAEKYRADDERILRTGKSETYEQQLQVEGREAWEQVVKMPVRDDQGAITGVFASFWDITARKQSEVALQASRQLLETAQTFRHP